MVLSLDGSSDKMDGTPPQEMRAAETALRRHNRILNAYLAAAKPAAAGEGAEEEGEARRESRQHDDMQVDEEEAAPSVADQSVMSQLSMASSATRVRREHRLQTLLLEARKVFYTLPLDPNPPTPGARPHTRAARGARYSELLLKFRV